MKRPARSGPSGQAAKQVQPFRREAGPAREAGVSSNIGSFHNSKQKDRLCPNNQETIAALRACVHAQPVPPPRERSAAHEVKSPPLLHNTAPYRTSVAEGVTVCVARPAAARRGSAFAAVAVRGTTTVFSAGRPLPVPAPAGRRQRVRRITGRGVRARLLSVATARLLRIREVVRRIGGGILPHPRRRVSVLRDPEVPPNQVGPSQIPEKLVHHVALEVGVVLCFFQVKGFETGDGGKSGFVSERHASENEKQHMVGNEHCVVCVLSSH